MAGPSRTVTVEEYERLKAPQAAGTTATKGEKAMSRNEKEVADRHG
jgi:hypothetical protein